MTGRFARRVLPLMGLALLGGCQMMAPGNRANVAADVQQPDMSSYFTQLLAQGRAHLQANRPAAALTAYRQASHDPASRAIALNGMAIAYDRIGRADLAQRYFLDAVALDPGNLAFAANLDRLNGNQAQLVEATAARAAATALQEQVDAVHANTAGSGGLQRVSEHEVRLATGNSGEDEVRLAPADMPSVVRIEQRPRNLGPRRQEYPVRVELAGSTARDPESSDRVARPARPRRTAWVAAPPGPRSPNYPVRVLLDQS